MTQTEKPTLPSLALDYKQGTMTNTMTGESAQSISGVVLAYRTDRVLWPTLGELPRLPLCVNGSEFGPCPCAFADWGSDGTPPDCSEELNLLLWDDAGAQVMVLPARRSHAKTIDKYLDMKALLGGILHDQQVTIRMTAGGDLHRLTLLPGELLDADATKRMGDVAARVQASGAWEGL